ncbi:HD-GYP domain-containing protein [Cellvibrio japonicus]|uniref:Putative HD-GYP hydrolase domain containing protein n=1 Tax=Cellvibrio japonicus (strain Ueda107) TaxID=498211 RepID=B3PIH0_CELJU|nr:HD domain-containing protein [Cellvibrio japonicus]ACE84942.1 putative HD-GYP hydrolase domain containing protein [Cellvibrio japonicus Ueda107]QEI12571.1 HD domain-containing protein [Cellvibrio japonicus]QEI16145.1 HD domain-containing protein [Cellvibrio japonicus]QEI19723.1 HD domain-containing protein [Cellvibrio japonicus]
MVSGLSSPLPDNVWDRLGLRAAGAYGGYLAAYSAGTLPAGVLIVRPVLDVQGNLLLSPHQPFDADALAALQGRSLAEPLARSVTLVSPLTVDMLRRDLTDWARQDSFFVVLEEHRPFLQQLATHAESLPEHPLLQQHLSVMASQMPGLYKRALFTALMAVLLGDEMRLSPADRRALFWAALYHDIGMLYVEPEILHKVEPLTLDEWFHI